MLQISDNFWTTKNLKKPTLNCLIQDYYLYKILLLQIGGEIEYDNQGLRFVNIDISHAKFEEFIKKASEEDVDLAITPEYSCPWSSLDSAISNSILPDFGKVWVFGCQTITATGIQEFVEKHADIVWIFDESLVQKNLKTPFFFDPVCYLLKTNDNNGEVKVVGIIQFKTHGFGGAGLEWERDNCIPGATLYVLENEKASTKMATIICSDTLQGIDFITVGEGYFKNSPLLLIHIQLNPKPFDDNYKLYRNLMFGKGNKDDWNKEVITLNWSKGITYQEAGIKKIFNHYGGSAFYIKTSQLELSDERISSNHRLGLYYTFWHGKRTHVYFLGYEEAIFLISHTKPSQVDSDPTQLKRSGPSATKTFQWNQSWDEVVPINSGFEAVCSEFEDGTGNLNCLIGNNNIVDVERIIQLSSGEIDDFAKEDWSNILKLFSFQIEDTEFNSRNTFSHDPNHISSDKRRRRIRRYHFLKNKILNNPSEVPQEFTDSLLKYEHGSSLKNVYLLNIHSQSTGRRGTAVYIGERTEAEARAFKSKLESLFSESQQGKSVIVWYNNVALNRLYDETSKPRISENVSRSSASIRKNNIR